MHIHQRFLGLAGAFALSCMVTLAGCAGHTSTGGHTVHSGAATSRFPKPIPDKTVVLTFDDAVKSHCTFVGPLLKEYGFGATFFITQEWMKDKENSMSWEDVAALHKMGFEIGNHSWTHAGFGDPAMAPKLCEELDKIDEALSAVGVPRPVSFGWPGNGFCPEALAELSKAGIKYARRGMQPEKPYGQIQLGPLYEPKVYDPLLIPTSGDAYPEWTLDHFKQVVDRAQDGKIAVVQFHGVPDIAHPWVHTPPERFREYMEYLKQGGFHVIALRDLGSYIDPHYTVNDPMRERRYPEPKTK